MLSPASLDARAEEEAKPKTMTARFVVLFFCLSLLGCASPAAPPKLEATWSDGETSYYDILGSDDHRTGAATWTIAKRADGWQLNQDLVSGARIENGEIVVDDKLAPVRSKVGSYDHPINAKYSAKSVEIEHRSKSGLTKKTVALAEAPIDNDASLQLQRAMPLAIGYRARYANVVTKAAEVVMVDIEVVGEEHFDVPAGSFDTFKVAMSVGATTQYAFYDKKAPHVLVRYWNPGAKSSFMLRAYRASTMAELKGPPDAPAITLPPPVTVNVPLVLLTVFVEWPLMIGLPIWLAVYVRRRFKVPAKVFWLGALAFVLSQVVHIPLNWALGFLGTPARLGLLPIVPFSIAVGLSAGLCEEIARYLMMRFALKSARSWPDALEFGVGHGGVEAILLGGLAALNFIAMVMLTLLPLSLFKIEGEAATQITSAARKAFSQSLDTPVLAGVERVAAIATHIALSVLVMRAVARRRIGYLLLAIALHATLDGAAVWMLKHDLAPVAIEAFALAFGALMTALTFALREPTAPVIVPRDAANQENFR
jgi:uncharacterized membrane protein YhfC